MSYPVRLARIAASVALTAPLLAACTSGHRTSGEAHGTGSPTAVPKASASYPHCHSNYLKGGVVADTDRRWTLTLTNVTTLTCRLHGWVGLDAISIVDDTATSGMLTLADTGNAVDVLVAPSQSAYTVLTRTSTGDARCTGHLTLAVTPPGETEALMVDLPPGSLCRGHVTVTALTGGTGPAA